MIYNPNSLERNSRSNSDLPTSNNFYLPNLGNTQVKQKSSLSVIPQRNTTFDNLRGREQVSPFGSPAQDFDRSIYDRNGRLVGMSVAKDSSIMARSRNETFIPMNNNDVKRYDNGAKSVLHKLLVVPVVENERFKLNAKISSMGILEGMYKDAADESTQKNQKTFEWKKFLDQQIIDRKAQKDLEMKQNQERDAMEDDKINKYLQSSSENFSPFPNNPFRTKDKFNSMRTSINLPQIQSPIKRQNPFDRSQGSLKALASNYFPDPTTTAHYALNNKIDELKHDLLERQRALMDQLKGLKKDADLSGKLRNIAVKATGPELSASSVLIHSQPVDILERFIQRNGGYEEWASYTGWKSDLLKNYFNIQRAKGGNLENLGIKGLITEEDMNDEEFILGIKQQFIDISSKGHVHKFMANAMKSRPGSRTNDEDLDYINYEADENGKFIGSGGKKPEKNPKLSNRAHKNDEYDDGEDNKDGGKRELQHNSMKVKGKPARFFGNPFRNNEGNRKEFEEAEENEHKNGEIRNHSDSENEYEDDEYQEGIRDGNMRGRGGKIASGKYQGNNGIHREDGCQDEENENIEGRVVDKNGKKSSKKNQKDIEEGDDFEQENEERGANNKADKTNKINKQVNGESSKASDNNNNQNGKEGEENSSGAKGKKSKKNVRFGENQVNGIDENDYEEDEEDENNSNNSNELSGHQNENEGDNGGAKKDKDQPNDKVAQSTLDNNKKLSQQDDENSQRKSDNDDGTSSNGNGEASSLNSIRNKKKQVVAAGKLGNQAKNNPTKNNANNNKNFQAKNTKQLNLKKKDENVKRDSSLSPNSKLINEVEQKVKHGRELLEEGEPELYAKQYYNDFLNNMGELGKGNYRKQGEHDSEEQIKMFQEKTKFVNTNQMSTMEFIQNTEEGDNELLRDSQNNTISNSGSQVSNEDEAEEYGNNPRPKKVVIPKRQLGEGEGLQDEPERGHARKRTIVRKPTEIITPLKVTSPLTATTKSTGKLTVKGRLEAKGRVQGRHSTLPGNKY